MITNLIVSTTKECNLRCSHCFREDYLNSFIKMNSIIDILDKNKEISYVNLFGGEPLLPKYYKNTLELIKFLKEKNIVVTITSNLTHPLTDIRKKLLLEFDAIASSWNPTRFNNENFKHWEENIKFLIKNNIEITCLITLTQDLIDLNVSYVHEMINRYPFTNVKFEPYIGQKNKPLNKQVDLWLTDYYKSIKNSRDYVKYSLYRDIEDNINKNIECGVFSRNCCENTLVLETTGNICKCVNEQEVKSFELKKININEKCYNCEHYRYCNGTCCLLTWDETGCPSYPILFKEIKGSK